MKFWQEDILGACKSVDCERKLFEVLAGHARELGFDLCAYGLRAPLPIIKRETVLLNNYPVAWQTRYHENNYLAIDPTVSHGLRSTQPIVWNDELFTSARRFWEEARSAGLRYGWAQSTRDAQGFVGMLTLARSSEPLGPVELRANGPRMCWLTQAAHAEMVRILWPKMGAGSDVKLSQREIDVLRWTADGKTSADISDILGISERTANFHISNAVFKLNAANKTAATVRAAVLGLL